MGQRVFPQRNRAPLQRTQRLLLERVTTCCSMALLLTFLIMSTNQLSGFWVLACVFWVRVIFLLIVDLFMYIFSAHVLLKRQKTAVLNYSRMIIKLIESKNSEKYVILDYVLDCDFWKSHLQFYGLLA